MSKITFRADDELITQLEEFDASKSEVMRQALREYLDAHADGVTQAEMSDDPSEAQADSLDELVAERVDSLIADRLDRTFTPSQPQDINVNISLEGRNADDSDAVASEVNAHPPASNDTPDDVSHTADRSKTPEPDDENTRVTQGENCSQCGENVDPSHVHCPNCGEKTSHRVFCDCGDEIRSDWAFCPSCGRRTPAADVLDST